MLRSWFAYVGKIYKKIRECCSISHLLFSWFWILRLETWECSSPICTSALECIKSEAPDFIGLPKVIGSLRPRKIISWLAWIKVSQSIFIFLLVFVLKAL